MHKVLSKLVQFARKAKSFSLPEIDGQYKETPERKTSLCFRLRLRSRKIVEECNKFEAKRVVEPVDRIGSIAIPGRHYM